MAYRRLPNTDNARLLAIIKLYEMLKSDDSVLKSYSEKIISFKVNFEQLIEKREDYKTNRRQLNKEKKELLVQLKVYVSHFLQVFNFAVDRGDINKEARKCFKLKTNTGVIPSLAKETEILKWACNIIEGEQIRINKGVDKISHPNFNQIRELVTATEKVINDLKVLEKLFKEYRVEIEKQRNKIDAFIKQIWNEIEFQFINESIEIKRKKAAQYGVVYVNN